MARVETRVARTDIYRNGLRTKSDNKQGYSIDRSQPRDNDDTVIVKKGQTYYTWQLFKSPRQISLTRPTRQQLTSSDFLRQVYDIEDQIGCLDSYTSAEELKYAVEGIVDELQNLCDEQTEKRDNMPEGLQDAPTGQLLEERAQCLEDMISELEGIDLDYDPEDEDTSEEDWISEKAEELCAVSYQGN